MRNRALFKGGIRPDGTVQPKSGYRDFPRSQWLGPRHDRHPLGERRQPRLWDEKIALDVLGSANLPEQAAQTLLFLAGVGASFTTWKIVGTPLRRGQKVPQPTPHPNTVQGEISMATGVLGGRQR